MADEQAGIFGIDLGTTYSVIAYIDDAGRPVVVRDQTTNGEITPSVVFFENEDNVVVGNAAKEMAHVEPGRVVSLVKREMGNEAYRRSFFGREHSAPAISALILKYLASYAQGDMGGTASKVVITVPAYFGQLERSATRQAGEIAGLDVVGIVPEPVAAALAYGLGKDSGDRTLLVFDLGGGTFDVTIFQVTASSVRVVVVDGDRLLGGADWDRALVEHFQAQAEAEFGPDFEMDDDLLQRMWDEAESMKKKLTTRTSSVVVFRADGGSFKVEVTRDEFEGMTRHLLERAVEITRRALSTAEAKVPGITGEIDDVLLVGGSTLMPVVKTALGREFGWSPQLTDPHLAVAKGAALYAVGQAFREIVDDATPAPDGTRSTAEAVERAAATSLAETYGIDPEQAERLGRVAVENVLPKAVGIMLLDTARDEDYVEHLVQPQTALPFEAEPFVPGTVVDGQDSVMIEIWEQAGGAPGRELRQNSRLAAGPISGLGQYDLPAGSPIEVYFAVSAEGFVTVHAKEPRSGNDVEVHAEVKLLDKAEVDRSKADVAALTVIS
ncbi:Hsp70 family protein [Myceligenerans halotolerans]